MNYNFDFAVSATISQKIVEEMVKKIVEEQTGRKVKSISFGVTAQSDRDDRYTTYVPNGCTVTFADANSIGLSISRGHNGDR